MHDRAGDRREEQEPVPEGVDRFRPTDATLLLGDREDTLAHLLRLTTRALDVQFAYVALIDGGRFIIVSQDGLSASATGIGQFAADGSYSLAAIAQREPVVLVDSAGRIGNPEMALIGSVAHAAIPLELPDGEMVGTLCAGSSAPQAWTPRRLEMLSHLAEATTLLLRNRQLIRATHSTSDLLRRMEQPIAELSSHVRSLVGLLAEADDARVRSFAALAESRAQTVEALLREIEGVTRSARERPPGGRRVVDIVELVRRSLASARAAAGTSDAFLDPPAMAIHAKADPLELEESLTRLLLSLMQYAGAEGQIHVRLARSEELIRLDVVKLGRAVPIAELTRMISQFRLGGQRPDAVMRLSGDTFSVAAGPVRARASADRTAFRITLSPGGG